MCQVPSSELYAPAYQVFQFEYLYYGFCHTPLTEKVLDNYISANFQLISLEN